MFCVEGKLHVCFLELAVLDMRVESAACSIQLVSNSRRAAEKDANILVASGQISSFNILFHFLKNSCPSGTTRVHL